MRATKSGYSEGDLFPLETSMGNVVHCKIEQLEWSMSYDSNQYTMLLDQKAMLAIADEYTYREVNKLDNVHLNTGSERSGKSHYVYAKKKFYESPLYQDKDRLRDILNTDNWDVSTFTRESKLDLIDINFELGDLRDRLKAIIEGYRKIITLDESGKGLSSLRWYDADQINLYIEFQIIGKKQAKVELVLPHKDDLNNRFRDRRVAFWHHILWLENKEKHTLDRGYVEVRKGDPSKWELSTYWSPYLVFRFPDLSNEEDWMNYEKKKDLFIEAHANEANQETSTKNLRYLNEANILINEMLHPSFANKRFYTEGEIASLLQVKQPTISLRMKTWKLKQEAILEETIRRRIINEQLNNNLEGVKNE